MPKESVLVQFLPGNGAEYMLPVIYIAADFARGPDGTCAFCLGDPCAERDDAPERIQRYMNGDYFHNDEWEIGAFKHVEVCPFCEGRAT